MAESKAEEEGGSPDVLTDVQTRVPTASNNYDGA